MLTHRVLLKMWTHPLLTLLHLKAGSKFIKHSLELKVIEMFCITMSLPKKADVRNISQMWVKISRWTETAGESRRCRLLTKNHRQSALNSFCPGCVRQETWGWGPVAYRKVPGQNTLGCSGKSFSPYCFVNISKRSSFTSVWKTPQPCKFQLSHFAQNKLLVLTSHRQPDFQCISWTTSAQQKLNMKFS